MATFGGLRNVVVDQENLAPGQGRRGVKVGVAREGVKAGRAALGEITNVAVRRPGQGSKAFKQAGSTFSIFCDDENSAPAAKALQRTKASQHLPGLQDKENQEEQEARKPLREVRKPQSEHRPRKQVSHEDPAILSTSTTLDSSMADTESPMDTSRVAMDTSTSDPALALAATWRVPPHGETVDLGCCPEYEQDIYAYLRSTEAKYQPKASYMDKQPDITHNMRQILVDWLVEVSEEYKLQTETLYLAVNFIDRFLSLMSVQRAKLQLVGTAAMFIASKFEEIYPPDVTEFVYITDDTYTKRQVLRMEHLVMKVLEFDVSPPTSHLFCSKLSAMAGSDPRTTSFAMYLNELTLMSASFLRYSPSLTAAASVALARHTVGLPAWPESVAEGSGYSLPDIQACLLDLHQQHVAAEGFQQQAMREKYKQSKHHCVSDIAPALVAKSL